MSWITSGLVDSPSAGTVLLEKASPINNNVTSVQGMVASSAYALVLLQRRNASNDATLQEQLIVCMPGNTSLTQLGLGQVELDEDERVRLVVFQDVLGTVSASFSFTGSE